MSFTEKQLLPGEKLIHLMRLSKSLDFKNHLIRQREACRSKSKTAGGICYSGAIRYSDTPRMLEKLASLQNRQIISESQFQGKKEPF
jgi:hypothetical protein